MKDNLKRYQLVITGDSKSVGRLVDSFQVLFQAQTASKNYEGESWMIWDSVERISLDEYTDKK